jgi:Uma2 family endonuclease
MVPLPTGEHSDVIDLLSDIFKAEISKQMQPWIVKSDVGVYIGINPNNGKDRSRTPDLCIMTTAQWAVVKAEKTKAAVLRTVPLLLVEIVSPSLKKTGYQAKEQEDRTIRIAEYWIVDLRQAKVSVLLLVDGRYQSTEFKGTEPIVSRTFAELNLTAQQVLMA